MARVLRREATIAPQIHPNHMEYLGQAGLFQEQFLREEFPIYLLSRNFLRVFHRAYNKLIRAFADEKIQLEQPVRCVMIRRIEEHTLVQLIEASQSEGAKVVGSVLSLMPGMQAMEYAHAHVDRGEWVLDGYSIFAQKNPFTKDMDHETFNAVWASVIGLLLYMQYGEITTSRVSGIPAKKQSRRKADLGLDITHVQSTWLENVVREKGFAVSGHFRMQPVGQGRKDRKLIWINDFEKHGYNRSADRWKHMPTPNNR